MKKYKRLIHWEGKVVTELSLNGTSRIRSRKRGRAVREGTVCAESDKQSLGMEQRLRWRGMQETGKKGRKGLITEGLGFCDCQPPGSEEPVSGFKKPCGIRRFVSSVRDGQEGE